MWEWSHVDISFRYIFIYRFPYLLMHYYSFLAQYHNKCLDINWSRLLRSTILSLWYSRFEVTWLLRDNLTAKQVFGLFTFYRRFCTTIFLSEGNQIFSQPRVKYFTNINQKCLLLLLFQLRWTLIQLFQIVHVNKPNTYFAVRVISQKSRELKARIPQWQDGGTK